MQTWYPEIGNYSVKLKFVGARVTVSMAALLDLGEKDRRWQKCNGQKTLVSQHHLLSYLEVLLVNVLYTFIRACAPLP